jgi:hypothetical protein
VRREAFQGLQFGSERDLEILTAIGTCVHLVSLELDGMTSSSLLPIFVSASLSSHLSTSFLFSSSSLAFYLILPLHLLWGFSTISSFTLFLFSLLSGTKGKKEKREVERKISEREREKQEEK